MDAWSSESETLLNFVPPPSATSPARAAACPSPATAARPFAIPAAFLHYQAYYLSVAQATTGRTAPRWALAYLSLERARGKYFTDLIPFCTVHAASSTTMSNGDARAFLDLGQLALTTPGNERHGDIIFVCRRYAMLSSCRLLSQSLWGGSTHLVPKSLTRDAGPFLLIRTPSLKLSY
ncbi:hypothetical protein C8F04DRAFT_1400018 [Mycena alexandri]|uniref:Uncharacterized protein n=1 Tax=Mycena alexandri TaxID=1745969 RepID=A0AAD6WZB7_9AGAR|nr:hypothetical protein C8F04DRAFT_1400018 [Mycena alexandri]